MPRDILLDHGHLFLGSRLKRLAERLQADAARILEALGLDLQPSQIPLLAAVGRYGPLSVNEAVEALGVSQPSVTRSLGGLVALGLLTTTVSRGDRRQKLIALSARGKALFAEMQASHWPALNRVVTGMCRDLEGPLLQQIKQLEDQMNASSFADRALGALASDELSIVEYSDDLAPDFYDISAHWMATMYTLEPQDRALLRNPRALIIDPGGVVLFVRSERLGIIGTCSLIKVDEGIFELGKMGVREDARGLKAGEFLLRAVLERAASMKIDTLFLLTHAKSAAAIHLYRKLGFVDDDDIRRTYGGRNERCNVWMRYSKTATSGPER